MRGPVYPDHRLLGRKSTRTAVGAKDADTEFQRRVEVRGLHEKLSQYYRLPDNKEEWTVKRLLWAGRRESGHLTLLRFA